MLLVSQLFFGTEYVLHDLCIPSYSLFLFIRKYFRYQKTGLSLVRGGVQPSILLALSPFTYIIDILIPSWTAVLYACSSISPLLYQVKFLILIIIVLTSPSKLNTRSLIDIRHQEGISEYTWAIWCHQCSRPSRNKGYRMCCTFWSKSSYVAILQNLKILIFLVLNIILSSIFC